MSINSSDKKPNTLQDSIFKATIFTSDINNLNKKADVESQPHPNCMDINYKSSERRSEYMDQAQRIGSFRRMQNLGDEDTDIMLSDNDDETNTENSNNQIQPLNEFYKEFVSYITLGKYQRIQAILKEDPEQFYGVIDKMDKTVLHIA